MELSRKAMSLSASVTLEITAKASELKSKGIDVISFGAGEPDYNTPENIKVAAKNAIDNNLTRYTPTSGIVSLKEKICDKLKGENGLSYGTNQVIVCTGAKQALADSFSAILNPGDEVIVASPYWVSYPELIKLNDGVPVFVETDEKNNFKMEISKIKEKITSKTKAIIINSPNNPTGCVYTKEDLVEIANLSKENDLIIISDEIYEKLIYDNEEHVSIAALSEDAFNRTIVINGFSKSHAMTGWRIGYAACGNTNIVKLMVNIQSHVTSNATSITQHAAVEAFNTDNSIIEEMRAEFEKRRNFMVSKINSIEGISAAMPKGAFYVMVNISKLFSKTFEGMKINNSVEFSKVLLEKKNVAVIPGEAFGDDNYIRLSYATSLSNIENGLNRVEEFVKTLK
ncbi:MAG: pyridoxal phosphate-dependent aminotransferase [Clostridiaceae bacterium]